MKELETFYTRNLTDIYMYIRITNVFYHIFHDAE
jgi:hypothetical protein